MELISDSFEIQGLSIVSVSRIPISGSQLDGDPGAMSARGFSKRLMYRIEYGGPSSLISRTGWHKTQ